MKRISVCIATYNGANFLNQQMESILSQIGSNDEIIISDDSSTDDTIKLLKNFKDRRIIIFENQKFGNPIFNFENAINHATGNYIFMSDQDDIWHEDKVKVMVEALDKSDLVICDCSIIDSEGRVLIQSYFDLVGSGSGIIKNLRKNTYFGCCMAFRKRLLTKALPFPKDIPMHDIWLGFVADVFFKSTFIPQKLTLYRKHDNNVSIASDVTSNLSLLTKLKFRFNLIKYLPILLLR